MMHIHMLTTFIVIRIFDFLTNYLVGCGTELGFPEDWGTVYGFRIIIIIIRIIIIIIAVIINISRG